MEPEPTVQFFFYSQQFLFGRETDVVRPATSPESGFRGVLWNDLGEQEEKMPTGPAVPLLYCTEWKLKARAMTKPMSHQWAGD